MSSHLSRTIAATLTVLTAVVGLGLVSAPAQAQPAIPVRCGDSSDEEIVLRWDDMAYDVSGTCGRIRVAADNVTVSMSTARRLVVTGRSNEVTSKSLDRLVVRGRANHVAATSVRSLAVTGRAARVRIEGLLDHGRVATTGAVLRADDAIEIHVDGDRNRLRVGKAWSLDLVGDDNVGRFRRLDERRVRGTGNRIVVLRG